MTDIAPSPHLALASREVDSTSSTSSTLPIAPTRAFAAAGRGDPRGRTATRRNPRGWLQLGLACAALVTAAACDGSGPAVDASTPVSAHTSAVSLRIDVAPGQQPSLTVLAFQAAFSGVPASDVLGMVDPLAASAPQHDCQLRDLDQAAAALVARGDAIELQELSGIGISVNADTVSEIRPSPRLYPDLAATIGGVVGEAGPLRLTAVPDQVRVRHGATTPRLGSGATPASTDAAMVGVPATGWVRLLNGAVPRDGILIPVAADLNLNVTPADATDTAIELRPFGGTVALSCAVPPTAVPASNPTAPVTPATPVAFVVPRQALAALVAASGGAAGAPVAAALDLVRRSNKTLPLSQTRVSLEVRTSTFVELRP